MIEDAVDTDAREGTAPTPGGPDTQLTHESMIERGLRATGPAALAGLVLAIVVVTVGLTLGLVYLFSHIDHLGGASWGLWTKDRFWASQSNFGALMVGVIAALVGAVAASLGTWFVAHKSAMQILRITSVQQAGLHERQEEFQRTQQAQGVQSRMIEGYSVRLRALSEALREDYFACMYMVVPQKDPVRVQDAATRSSGAFAEFEGLFVSFGPGDLQDSLEHLYLRAYQYKDGIFFAVEGEKLLDDKYGNRFWEGLRSNLLGMHQLCARTSGKLNRLALEVVTGIDIAAQPMDVDELLRGLPTPANI